MGRFLRLSSLFGMVGLFNIAALYIIMEVFEVPNWEPPELLRPDELKDRPVRTMSEGHLGRKQDKMLDISDLQKDILEIKKVQKEILEVCKQRHWDTQELKDPMRELAGASKKR